MTGRPYFQAELRRKKRRNKLQHTARCEKKTSSQPSSEQRKPADKTSPLLLMKSKININWETKSGKWSFARGLTHKSVKSSTRSKRSSTLLKILSLCLSLRVSLSVFISRSKTFPYINWMMRVKIYKMGQGVRMLTHLTYRFCKIT